MHKYCYGIYRWRTLLLAVSLIGCLSVFSQTNKRYAHLVEDDTIVDFKDRWSFHTNAVNWLLTVPNVAVEFDLSNSVYNKWTLNLGGKWNWQTAHNYLPYNVLNLWEIRAEARKYWRTEFRANVGKPTLQDKLFSKRRQHPRYWRAYYVGVYAHAGKYSFKFGNEGVQGEMYGSGISFGYSIPLYSYHQNYIDIEFGGSVGLVATKNSKFRLDRENNAYVPSESPKGLRIVPFPVLSDLRVSFIYRFSSIKDKYKRVNYAKIQAREQRKMEKKRLKDSIRTAGIIADSLERVRKTFVKDSIRQVRLVADSLEQMRKGFVEDSIKRAEIIADRLDWALKNARKDDGQLPELLGILLTRPDEEMLSAIATKEENGSPGNVLTEDSVIGGIKKEDNL